MNQGTRTKISNALKGKPKSLEHRKRLSEIRKLRPNRYWLGKKRSAEDIEKFRLSHIGKKQTPASNLKRSAALSGNNNYQWGKGNMDGRTRRKYAPRPEPPNCEACGIPSLELSRKKLFVDHCHKTNEFRGWLCTKCNVALGMVNDDINKLTLLIKYLHKYGSDSSKL